ncbi:MAG: hypothetical protein J5I93_08640, partial [Pirellulaceae bacterium]|nr:hypothetical protein [Pirellulaceae bacterium]
MQRRAVCPRCAHQFELAERQLAREHEQRADSSLAGSSLSAECGHGAIGAAPAGDWAAVPADHGISSLSARARRGRHTWPGIFWR